MGYYSNRDFRSPKSKETCRVSKKQLLWLYEIIRKQPGLKSYCMIKKLVLFVTKSSNYFGTK